MTDKLNHQTAALRVCVDRAQAGRVSGTVYSRRLRRPMPFADMGSLLLQVDAVLDAQNFPQAFQRSRTFQEKGTRSPSAYAADSLEEGLTEETVEEARGEIATFLLSVITRRSSSWQGQVDWLDGAPVGMFSSALELIKLVDDRLFGG